MNLTAANFAGMDLTGVQFGERPDADVDFTGVDLTGGLISMVGGTVHPAAQNDTTFAVARLRCRRPHLTRRLSGAIDPHMLLEADRDWSGTTFPARSGRMSRARDSYRASDLTRWSWLTSTGLAGVGPHRCFARSPGQGTRNRSTSPTATSPAWT
ncbi:MAG: hypothetical protein R2690_04930 [Acidimicrobiales bacterium]